MASSHPQTHYEDGGDNAITTETTPLLTTSSQSDNAREGSKPPISSSSPPSTSSPKPLPKTQILLLCYARLVEPIAFFSIFPYINQMILSNSTLSESEMGFYSGLIESLFSLTQMLVMVFWGYLSDRIGRKPVLVSSLFGVVIATALFGLAKSIPQMILFRCAAGVFAGSIVTIRTMISELSTKQTQATAFSWFAVAGNIGIFIGPLIGGALADPVSQYPSVFGNSAFFTKFPYALSNFAVAGLGMTAVLTSALFIHETLPRSIPKPDSETASETRPHRTSTRSLVSSPGVSIVLYNYGHVMLLAFAYTAVVPVFWATSVSLGGLGFSYLQISLFMALTGLSQAIWLLLIFPPLQHRWGTNGVMRACGNAYPFFLGCMPLLNAALRLHSRAGDVAFWIMAPTFLSLGPGVSMAFTGAQLALNDVSPSHETLGMLNALALTLSSGLRSFSPALFASIFAIGVGNQFFYGYLVWIVLVLLALGFTVSTRYLPETSEEPPDNEHADLEEDASDRDSNTTIRD
ncbi:major facilitator superfamily transporter [Xylaria bambusicola]|uniref:major facilitator superfamily transporter n=1 Tax=Xylaria bambusicola TaxID=326684 RepID=UPI002008360A|nr:major facilitator superfamily transporter [Xylaria bambusicola]KAI0508991.1 major facilitator superfamily transporter [Xylaria bambusicola]